MKRLRRWRSNLVLGKVLHGVQFHRLVGGPRSAFNNRPNLKTDWVWKIASAGEGERLNLDIYDELESEPTDISGEKDESWPPVRTVTAQWGRPQLHEFARVWEVRHQPYATVRGGLRAPVEIVIHAGVAIRGFVNKVIDERSFGDPTTDDVDITVGKGKACFGDFTQNHVLNYGLHGVFERLHPTPVARVTDHVASGPARCSNFAMILMGRGFDLWHFVIDRKPQLLARRNHLFQRPANPTRDNVLATHFGATAPDAGLGSDHAES